MRTFQALAVAARGKAVAANIAGDLEQARKYDDQAREYERLDADVVRRAAEERSS